MIYAIVKRNPFTGASEQTPIFYACQRDEQGNLVEFKDSNGLTIPPADMAVKWAKEYEALVNDGFQYGVKLAE